jgi:hypothetical protein
MLVNCGWARGRNARRPWLTSCGWGGVISVAHWAFVVTKAAAPEGNVMARADFIATISSSCRTRGPPGHESRRPDWRRCGHSHKLYPRAALLPDPHST